MNSSNWRIDSIQFRNVSNDQVCNKGFKKIVIRDLRALYAVWRAEFENTPLHPRDRPAGRPNRAKRRLRPRAATELRTEGLPTRRGTPKQMTLIAVSATRAMLTGSTASPSSRAILWSASTADASARHCPSERSPARCRPGLHYAGGSSPLRPGGRRPLRHPSMR